MFWSLPEGPGGRRGNCIHGAPTTRESVGESSLVASIPSPVLIMAKAAGIAVLCCALASCQAFLAPVCTSSSVMSSGQRSSSRGQQQCYSSRRPRTALSMKEEATAESAKVAEAVVVEGAEATAAAEDAGNKKGRRSGSNRQDLYKNQPKPV